ncbi:hypothetical protein AB4865_01120 [Capnocytophaga sp. ARDL2]|uniref:hypothetical protein n=1 Tax=Capnocytophaga sp. ARDL2 TaxID=3238809 RepID=UPI0035575E0D
MTEAQQAIISIAQGLDEANAVVKPSFEAQFEALVEYIDDLIQRDFNKLISILYRVDVSEEKLKKALQENKHTPTCQVIATMLLERELEKRKRRTLYKQPPQ